MLTRLIVNLYAWIMEIYLWLVLLISGVAGYHYTIPLLKDMGAIPETEAVWKIYGALAFAVAALLLSPRQRSEHRRWNPAFGGGFVGGGDLQGHIFAAGLGAEDQGEGQAGSG